MNPPTPCNSNLHVARKRGLARPAFASALLGILMSVVGPSSSFAQVLSVCPDSTVQTCAAVCEIAIPVLVTGSAELNALGFELVFDGPALNLSRVEPGALVRDWQAFDAQHVEAARVRVGGFAAESVRLAGTDTLVVLVFESTPGVGCTRYHTEGFVDDLEGAAACMGRAQWDPECVELPVLQQTWSSVKRRFTGSDARADP